MDSGADFSDGDAAMLPKMARHYAMHGVTTFLATTMTLPEDALCRAGEAIAGFRRKDGEADCAGVFMEGPFLSVKNRGAHPEALLCAPDEPGSPVLFARGTQVAADMGRLLRASGAKGGGRPDFAQGAGEPACLIRARDALSQR